MLASIGQSRVKALVQHRNLITLGLAVSVLLNVMLASLSLSLWHGMEEKFMPPMITEPMTIGRNGGDAAYLRNTADYFARLFLNITPSNAVERIEQVLRYVHPKDYGLMKKQLQDDAKGIDKTKQSRYFTPISYEVDVRQQQVEVIGDETFLIGRKLVGTYRRAYRLGFTFEQGMPYLNEFKLISEEIEE